MSMTNFTSSDINGNIQPPYDKVLYLLGTLNIEANSTNIELYLDNYSLSTILNSVKTYSDILINNKNVFPVKLKQLFEESLKFSTWTTNFDNSVQSTIIWGCVYYVLAVSGDVAKHNLSLLDKLVEKNKGSYQYFQHFKDALEENDDNSQTSSTLQRREIEERVVLDEPELSLHQETQRRIVEHHSLSVNGKKQSESLLIKSLNAQIEKLKKDNEKLRKRVAELESIVERLPQQNIIVQGDYTVNKHVDNQVSGVKSGGTGINVNKEEK